MKQFLLIVSLFCINQIHAQVVLVPNTQLMGELTEYGYDVNRDGILTVEEAETHTSLIIRNYGITDFTGIEAFKNLVYFDCLNNALTSLDLSKNTKLRYLNCNGNKLLSLDLSNNKFLDTIYCKSNSLTNINLSSQTNLKALDISSNQISNLELTANTKLENLACTNNSLQSINLSNNTELSILWAYFNELGAIDLSKNTKLNQVLLFKNKLTNIKLNNSYTLEDLECSNNLLTELNLSSVTNLKTLNASSNNLTQICVADSNLAKQLNFNKDANTVWAQNCVAGIDNIKFKENIYSQNPASDSITILNNQIKETSIFDMNGKLVLQTNSNNISVNNLKKGIYTIQFINNQNKKITDKLIIE